VFGVEFSVKKMACCTDESLASVAQYAKLRVCVASSAVFKIRSMKVS